MRALTGPQRFVLTRRGPSDPNEVHRVERVLATARVFLAICGLLAIYLDPTAPSLYATLAYGLLIFYVILSLLILLLLRVRPAVQPGSRLVVHGLDLLWPATITLFTEGPNSPFFVFFLFVLLAAAYRWGLLETLATAGAAILLLSIQAVLLTSGPRVMQTFLEGEFQLNRLILRAAYLLIMGVLLGYLAKEEKQLRAETSLISRIMAKVQAQTGLRATLEAVFTELLHLAAAPSGLLVLHQAGSDRLFLWTVEQQPKTEEITFRLSELEAAERPTYLFEAPAHSWHMIRRSGQIGDRFDTVAVDGEGRRVWDSGLTLPLAFPSTHAFNSLLVVSVTFGEEWAGRLFLFDPSLRMGREGELRFLQTVMRQVAPAIHSVYLLRRLRSHVGAVERARVARELHDGAIQSLVALEMQLDVLRRQATSTTAQELAHIEQLLHQEVLNLRELMQEIKPLNLDPTQLLDFLAESVEKFRRESGIAARFVSDVDEVTLPPHVCRELARTLQEALVNVRKHSGATNVLVRFASRNGCWTLVVDDDGRGFPFSGRLSHAELDATRKGPVVIKERVRSLGGELTLESTPGRGTRLEITLPPRARG